ncbi:MULTISPECIES: ComF family protein [unclassified Leptolyngbya]|uniref:ComF family protein n=1 Tax=unclassified Leptolyngbya TaxID=2650499 RepID=UPI0016831BE9|nr:MULTISPECIES: ComF family protein [unclassified Leptolyngbya]MBD1913934.1 ComF family protein [Leptolyngbya sp. FACHB-8]MBD2156573.1 ComF family protein [Leptolyngbya sp. FACHB-16]
MPSFSGWTRYFEPLVNLVLAKDCPLCERPTQQELCPSCIRQVQHCQLPTLTSFKQETPPVFAWGQYGGALKRAIASLKYENHPQLAQPLGHWMGRSWKSIQHPPKLLVVPIPMHPDKHQQRGFNQAELLADSFCQITRLPLERRALLRVRSTHAQFGLSTDQRSKNLMGAMQVNPPWHCPSNSSVLLLDDIYTTGATAQAAIHAFKQQGIRVYGVMALARAMKEGT